MAIETHAFRRARQIKSPRELLRAVFSYAVADYSLREVAALLTGEHRWISDQAVHERLSNCGAWLETLLAHLLGEKATQVSSQIGRSLKIVDATILTCPAARGTDYRLHLCYEPISQSSCGVKLTDVKGAERFTHFDYDPLDIVLGDRIYGTAKHIIKVIAQGADVLVRQSLQQLGLYTQAGERVDWQELLIKAQATGRLLLEAYIRDAEGQQAKVFIVGQRLREAEIESARRQVKRSASDKGHKTRAATLLAGEWLTVLTTLGPAELSAEMILQLYRVRWHIELYIKCLKSILKLGQLRASRGSQLARVHLLAKMISALVVETVAVERLGREWRQMTRGRRGTWFRVWKMIRDELTETISGTSDWQAWQWRLMLKVIWERRRKRKLQRLSKQVISWLHESPSSKLTRTSNQPSLIHLAA
ncbi:MAG: transposase [Acidobacteria bacterium]|nr:transposase [Acidobacteriota bacterium]